MTEAAHELGVKRQAIFIAIKRGLLPSRKREIPPFGDVVFIGRQDFEAWAERSANRRRTPSFLSHRSRAAAGTRNMRSSATT